MKTIQLTRGKVALVDDCDYERLSMLEWCALKHPSTFYAVKSGRTATGRKMTYMHREILKPPHNMQCDHIDGNGLDNRRCNLRICTQAENLRNGRARAGSSRFKGVSWHKSGQKWLAQIKDDGKTIYLGLFPDETEAARAYDAAARELFGEFARPNFPEEVVIE
jgi:hypothetical protein